ncbi:MAG TPA: DoxX-like family protein [Luteolibacter sp.]
MRESAPTVGLLLLRLLTGGVWVFHGLFSKLLDGIPRHRLIVGRILGDELARPAVLAVGVLEICLGLWALSGHWRKTCATVQTLGIVAMNALEILFARDLLISAPGMVALNAGFLGLVWYWATWPES